MLATGMEQRDGSQLRPSGGGALASLENRRSAHRLCQTVAFGSAPRRPHQSALINPPYPINYGAASAGLGVPALGGFVAQAGVPGARRTQLSCSTLYLPAIPTATHTMHSAP